MSAYYLDDGDATAASILFSNELDEALAKHEHYWLAALMWRVNPPFDRELHLDGENVRSGVAVVCGGCDARYSKALLDQPCPGGGVQV